MGRTFRVLLGAVLLTTCSTDTVGPGGRIVGVMQPGALLLAADDFGIPIDQVVVGVRRTSDNSVAFSRVLSSSEFTSNPDDLRIRVPLELRTRTEDFSFSVTARIVGVDYYQATGTITAVAYETAVSSPIVPAYVGPGAAATDMVWPANTQLGGGQTATLTAKVLQGEDTIAGVPVAFSSSDSSAVIPVRTGLNSVSVTAPASGSGSVTIRARLPNDLTRPGIVSWTPTAAALVLVSGNGQTVNTNTAAPDPLVVRVEDAQGGPVAGTDVTFALVTGPTGTVVSPVSVISNAQGLAQTTLTAGSTAGAITVTATAPGLSGSPVSFTATAVTNVGVPSVVVANSPTTQNAVVNTAVATPPSVIVRDAQGTAVPDVTVTFAVASGGGSLTGGTQTTNASGVATVGSWTVGTATGPNTLTATVANLTPATFTATATAAAPAALTMVQGDSQTANSGEALPVPPTVELRDQFNNPVPGVTVTWTPSDGSAAPPTSISGADGRAATTWTLGAGQLQPTLTASVVNLPSVVFHATTVFTTPTILLSTGGNPLVGVGLSTAVDVTLSEAAGPNGVTVTLSSDNTSIVTVGSATINIPQGGTTGSFPVTGISAGATTVRATAPGYTAGSLGITATLQIISLPVTLNVPFGQNQNFPVSLAVAAPAGGVVVQLATSDATRVSIVTPTVTIPAGSQVGTGTAFGVLPGPATITATATGFVGASSSAATTAVLSIVQGSASLNPTFGTTVTVELRSGASTVPAPSGGLVVNVVAGTPGCLNVPATVTIPQGLVNTTIPLTYGGTGAPCTSTLTVSAPNITPDTINVTVTALPPINLQTPGQFSGRVGAGLQDVASGFLGATPPTPVTVRLTSSDPTKLLFAPNATTAGTDFLDVVVPANQTGFTYYTQALDTGVVTITASATGFANGTTPLTIPLPGIDLSGIATTTTSLGTTDPFVARIGPANAGNTALSALQSRRFGSGPLTITVLNSNPAVGHLSTTAAPSADSVEVTLAEGLSQTPSSIASGGVAFDPVGAGTTVISARAPGFLSMTSAVGTTVTVNQPTITISQVAQFTNRVGVGLQDQAFGSLQNPLAVADTLHLVSGDPTRFLLSRTDSTPGTPTLDIPMAAGAQNFNFYIQGIAPSTGAVPITATMTGFTSGTANVTIAPAGIDIVSLATNTTSLTANAPFVVRIGAINANGTALVPQQTVRAGQPAVVATLTSSDPAVGQLITLPDSASPVTVTIPVRNGQSAGTVANGGVAFDPINAGTTTVHVTAPGFDSVPGAFVNVTVTAPTINLQTPAQFTGRLGNGLMDNASGSLQAAPGFADTVFITASDTTILKFSANTSTPGVGLLAIPITPTTTSFSYVVHGYGTGVDTIRATATGYTAGSVQITLVQPGLVITGLPTTATTFSANDPFQVSLGAPNVGNTALSVIQPVRAGADSLVVNLANSNGTVAQLVTTAVTGNAVTVKIGAGQSASATSVAGGGAAFDPLVAGTTTVTATAAGYVVLPAATVNVTVSAPNITLNTPGQFTGLVGAGLMDAASGSFQSPTPGPLTLRIKSSNPGVALVSANPTTAGADSVDIPIAAGASSFTYYIHGVEGATGIPQISATAPGYNTGVVTVNIVQPGLQLSSLSSSYSATGANDPFQVVVGVPNSNNSALSAFQSIRFGGTALTVTITSNPGVAGTLVTGTTTPVSSNSATVTIQPGQNASPSTRAAGGIEFDPLTAGTTTVSASGAPFMSMTAATQVVTVN